jgi:putative nucleotidyltransferase with HDIG domain
MWRFTMRWWVPFVAVVGGTLAVLSLGGDHQTTWGHPGLAFVLVLLLTFGCAVGAAAVWVVGLARRLAEVCLLGSVLWVVSLLPLVHGLLLPGTLYGPNPGTDIALMAAVPAALLAALPVLLDGRMIGRWLSLHWLPWSVLWLALSTGGAAALLIWPRSVAAPVLGGPVAVAIVAVSLAGTGILSLRHLRLYAIGRRAGSLIASLGFIAPGLATLAFLGAEPLSAGWWLAHFTDGLGVLFAAGGLLISYYQDRSLSIVLSPVLTREPLVALELGLTPVVHRFIADLETKDDVTRMHVIRVGELAMRAGERAGLDPVALRALGLGALLHDVGKLLTPDSVLKKPGALTDEERAVIQLHPVDGAELLGGYPHLAKAANIVRAHHERPDGAGYPDGLTAADIPLGAAIVSVVDSWDAMVSDRPYRDGMPAHKAESILRDGAGTQWREGAVELVLAEVHARGSAQPERLERVGRLSLAKDCDPAADSLAGCLPEYLRAPAQTPEVEGKAGASHPMRPRAASSALK